MVFFHSHLCCLGHDARHRQHGILPGEHPVSAARRRSQWEKQVSVTWSDLERVRWKRGRLCWETSGSQGEHENRSTDEEGERGGLDRKSGTGATTARFACPTREKAPPPISRESQKGVAR